MATTNSSNLSGYHKKKEKTLKVKCNEIWSYQQKVESTLKIRFSTSRGAQDKKIRRFPRALRKQTRNNRA